MNDDYRFDSKTVRLSSGCLMWYGATGPLGYGQFYSGGRPVRAHRFSYQRQYGQIPEGLVLDHLCRNPWCVEPSHLEPVTQKENVHRSLHANSLRRSANTCKWGHDLTESNVIVRRNGTRECKACGARRHRERYVSATV